MKINSISIKNFRSHVDTKLDGLARINVILGRNGAGKSTILDAIAYALTGACRGITDGGVGADGLVSDKALPPKRGKPNFTVGLSTDKGEILRAGGQGPKSVMQGSIEAMHGVHGAKWCGIRPDEFLGLSPADQRDIILGVYGSDTPQAVQAPENDLLKGRDLSTLAGIDEAEDYLRNMRPILKRQLADMPPAKAPEATPEQLSVLNDELKRARALLQDLRLERDRVIADWNGQTYIKKNAAAELVRVEHELSVVPTDRDPEADRKDLAAGVARIQELEEVDQQTTQAMAKAEADLAVMLAEMDRLTATANRLMSVKGTCPTCLREYTEATRVKALSDLKEQGKRVNANIVKARERVTALSGDSHSAEIADLRREMAGLADAIAAEPTRHKRIEDLKQRQDKLTAQATLPIDDSPPVHDIETRIGAGETWIEKRVAMLEASGKAQDTSTAYGNLSRQLEQTEMLIAYLGPQSPLRASLSGGPTRTFLADVNPTLKAVGLPDMAIDPGWCMSVGGTRLVLLSTSERYRVGLAIACALAKKSGLGILCLDGIETLDLVNRTALESALNASGLQQAIVAMTVSASYGNMPDDWESYHVENVGGVSRVQRCTVTTA